MHFERDAAGRVRKLGEGGFGKVQAQLYRRCRCYVMMVVCCLVKPRAERPHGAQLGTSCLTLRMYYTKPSDLVSETQIFMIGHGTKACYEACMHSKLFCIQGTTTC